MFWGISPALDLQDEYYKYNKHYSEEFNILLIGGCDARHVLKTIAQRYRHTNKKLNIFIVENCLELVSRQLLLLSIALETSDNLGLLEKTRLFMEIYGNTLIRPSVSKYVIAKSNSLIKMITNFDFMAKMLPNIKFNGIKYRERDYIEMLLQFWKAGDTNLLNICELWDKRIRKSLGTRYDAKIGVFDWDYNMRLRDIGGTTVSSQEFQYFRNTGIAFTWLDSEPSRPNNTLAAGVIKFGDNFTHRGYVGDIVTGPYITYGLSCEDSEMLKTVNGKNIKRATDLTERNIKRMLYEIENSKPFDPKHGMSGDENYNLGMSTVITPDFQISSENNIEKISHCNFLESPSLNIDSVDISFHSSSVFSHYPNKKEYNKYFDIVFVSHNFVEKLATDISNMIKDNGLIIIESQKFILDWKKEIIKSFTTKVEAIKQNFGCHYLENFNPQLDAYAKLQLKSHK